MVFTLSISRKGIDQYADAASRVDQYLVPGILFRTSRMCGNVYVSFSVISFNPRKSHTKRIDPSFFFTKIAGHSKGRWMVV